WHDRLPAGGDHRGRRAHDPDRRLRGNRLLRAHAAQPHHPAPQGARPRAALPHARRRRDNRDRTGAGDRRRDRGVLRRREGRVHHARGLPAGDAVLRAVLPPPHRGPGARGGVRRARAGGVRAGRIMTLDELKQLVEQGEVDTVVLALCDMQGRLMGKRLTARHFVDEVAEHGAEGCNYLLAVDVDMNTVEGYDMASWSRGYGDFVLKPDMDTLRPLPWL